MTFPFVYDESTESTYTLRVRESQGVFLTFYRVLLGENYFTFLIKKP